MMNVTFISIVPNLLQGEGHIVPYHDAVGQAAQALGWQHVVIFSCQTPPGYLPNHWHSCSNTYQFELEENRFSKLLRLPQTLQEALKIANFLKKHFLDSSNPSDLVILFLERFVHLQLLTVVLALYFLPKEKLAFWILYRRDIHRTQTKNVYKILNQLANKKLGNRRLSFLTDSDLLQKSLSDFLEVDFTVMPIPHTEYFEQSAITVSSAERLEMQPIYCWWPGTPRLEKGWQVLKRLVSHPFDDARKICIVAARSAAFASIAQDVVIQQLEDPLPRQDYRQWLAKSDFILLPYQAEPYRERTSGIFVECIFAGKLPLVTGETWMARELEQYGLDALIVDWSSPTEVYQRILCIFQDVKIKQSLIQMQATYQNKHNIISYSKIIKSLLLRTGLAI